MKFKLENILDEISSNYNDSINQKALWHTIRFAISLVDLLDSEVEDDK